VLAAEIDKSYRDWRALGRAVPIIAAAFAWLRANTSRAHGRRSIVHGDFNFNNLLIEGDRVSAIVDWEFVHVDNPAADLGWFHYGAEGVAGWAAFLDAYAAAGGARPAQCELDYHILLGQTRLAVMTQQSEAGFEAGQYDDVKFAAPGARYVNQSPARLRDLLRRLLSAS
jgi:aminoglycoside phosphotransferase (APT) family kinase protein